MRLAAVLLCMIAFTHYGYDPVAGALYAADQQRAARALFYVFRGAEGLALFALVGLLARRRAVWFACVWGMVEEGETAACRLAVGIENAPGYEMFSGLCGTGWYWVGLFWGLMLAAMLLDWRRE